LVYSLKISKKAEKEGFFFAKNAVFEELFLKKKCNPDEKKWLLATDFGLASSLL